MSHNLGEISEIYLVYRIETDESFSSLFVQLRLNRQIPLRLHLISSTYPCLSRHNDEKLRYIFMKKLRREAHIGDFSTEANHQQPHHHYLLVLLLLPLQQKMNF